MIEEAERSGMFCWIYDEVNWPSGSAGGLVTVKKGLSEYHIEPDGSLSRGFDKKLWEELSPDYLNHESVEAFLKCTYEEYARRFSRHFGKTVLGVFNDEIRFANANPWSPALPDHRQFSVAQRVRKTGGVFRKQYLQALADWCQNYKLLLMGHVMGEENLGTQVRYLGGDLMSMIGIYQVPGIDHLGDKAEGLHPIYLSSAAHLMQGNPTTMCETGSCLPWEFSEIDLRRVSGFLYAHGVHRQVLHGFFYAPNPTEWMPDMFFRWKNWADMKKFALWASRVQSLRDRLVAHYEVAVYFPVDEFIDDYQPNSDYTLAYSLESVFHPPISGQKALSLHRALQSVPNALKQRHINYVLATRDQLHLIENLLLVVPCGCEVSWKGLKIEQGWMTPEAVADAVIKALPHLPSVEGPGSVCRPLSVRDDIADPHLHSERDEGGVILKTYGEGMAIVISAWNAEPAPFNGVVHTGKYGNWTTYDPQIDRHGTVPGPTDAIRLEIAPYSFVYLRKEE
jgi:hypothetical protein